mmetsp:Transcript_6611/g.29099  ORF Transcript_6611/g.29099 Transcript_6611/m.29099 type:complete len:231 (+) Transcript_6611:83-775(+)
MSSQAACVVGTLSAVVSGALPPSFSHRRSRDTRNVPPSGPRLVAPRPRLDLLVLRGSVKVAHGSQAGGVGEHGQLLVHALGLRGEPLQEDSLLRSPRLLQLRGLVPLTVNQLLERAEERALHLGEHRARGVQRGRNLGVEVHRGRVGRSEAGRREVRHLRVEGAAHAPQRGVWVVADGRVLDLLGVEVVIRLGEREGVVRGVNDLALGSHRCLKLNTQRLEVDEKTTRLE